MQIERHLVTTSDERTWKFDRPVLFLGEWCCLYDRNATWKSMDAKVAAPFGLGVGKKSSDIDYVQSLSATLLVELAAVLNVHHNTNHTSRYWNILLGHWLRRCVSVCFNRYFTIEKVLTNYKITSTTVLDSTDYCLATSDSSSATWACNDVVWNSMLYARVLRYMNCNNVDLDIVRIENDRAFKQKQSIETTKHIWNIKRFIKAVGYYILPRFTRNDDAFIVNSYLPLWQEIKLQLALWQCPQIWQSMKMRREGDPIKRYLS